MVESPVADAALVETSPAVAVLLAPDDEPPELIAEVELVPAPVVVTSGAVVDGDTVVNTPVSPCGCWQARATGSKARAG